MSRALFCLFLSGGIAWSDDKPKPGSPAENLAALMKVQKDAEAAYEKTATDLPDTVEGNKKGEELWMAFDKGQGVRLIAAFDLAKSDPKSEVAWTALEWILANPRSYYLDAGIPAMKLAAEHHAANPKIAKTIARLGRMTPAEKVYPKEYDAAMTLLRAVAEKNTDRTARGQAMMGLAWEAFGKFAVAEYKRSSDEEKFAHEAEAAFERVVKDYGDCMWLWGSGKRTLGEFAEQNLFELRHLRIGKTAPEIESNDLDGKKFKLSDSRGKVTLIVFWASWCGPCMREVPHEKKLVERLKDKPFALIGVNGDEDAATARKCVDKHGIPWRSFWDGERGSKESISDKWNLSGWPTVYLLDAKGTIRYKGLNREELDRAVDELVSESVKK